MVIGSRIIAFDTVASTNNMAALLLHTQAIAEGTTITAKHQTEGRGQGGNTWHSERNNNLLFSIIIHPESISPEEQVYITMFVSVGICRFLTNFLIDGLIKWPNDIYVGNDKLAGILIENLIWEGKISSSIIGVGLNVNQTLFPPNVPNATSLKTIIGRSLDTTSCLKLLLKNIDIQYKKTLYGNRETLEREYHSRLITPINASNLWGKPSITTS